MLAANRPTPVLSCWPICGQHEINGPVRLRPTPDPSTTPLNHKLHLIPHNFQVPTTSLLHTENYVAMQKQESAFMK